MVKRRIIDAAEKAIILKVATSPNIKMLPHHLRVLNTALLQNAELTRRIPSSEKRVMIDGKGSAAADGKQSCLNLKH